jgi:hypothetical protein
MASKQDLLQKLKELQKRSMDLNKDLNDLSDLLLYSDLIQDTPVVSKAEIKPEPPLSGIIPSTQFTSPSAQEVIPKKVVEFKTPVVPSEKKAPIAPSVVIKPPVIVKPPPPRKKTFFEKNPDLEKFIGERLITFIGIAILVTGIAFFVKFAIDKEWINEIGRTCIGILCGGIILGVAHRLRKNFRTFSSILVGGGIAVLYFTITYAFQNYHKINFTQTEAFGCLVAITAFTVLLSISYDRKELAILAIVGGFGSPLMVMNGAGNFPVLCIYMLILNLGMLSLAYFRKWNLVNLVSYGFTILLFGGAVGAEMYKKDPAYIIALIFATAYYFIFFGMNVINNLKLKNKFGAMEIISLLSNSFLYYGTGYFILFHAQQGLFLGLFTLGAGIFNFVFAYFLYKRQDVDKNLVFFLIGLVLSFISLAGPVQLHGHYITLFWGTEAVLLLWLWQKSKIILIRYASLIVNFLMIISLLIDWIKFYGSGEGSLTSSPVWFNKAILTSLFILGSLLATIFLLKKETDHDIVGKNFKGALYQRILFVAFIVITYFGIRFELIYQYQANLHSISGVPIITALFNSIFVLALILSSRYRNLQLLQLPATILGLMILLLYFVYPHFSVIDVRNNYLFNNLPVDRFPFALHFFNTALIITLVFLVRKLIVSSSAFDNLIKTGYTWMMCIVLVFAGSSELDHFFVINLYSSSGDMGGHALDLSHRIGYPIFWGLFSLVVMVIGMRRRNRQLRIISLSLFFITVIKLISLGLYGDSEAGKIIAFISSGVILLVVAFMYQKLKKLFVEDEPPTTESTLNPINDEA